MEGAEYKVMKGAINFLTNQSPTVIMEYIEPNRLNEAHQSATRLLRDLGYRSYIILANGELKSMEDIDAYLISNKLESENIVFRK